MHCGLLLCQGTTLLTAPSGGLPLISSSRILDCGHFFVLQLQSQCYLCFQPIKCDFSDCSFLAASESPCCILILLDPFQVLHCGILHSNIFTVNSYIILSQFLFLFRHCFVLSLKQKQTTPPPTFRQKGREVTE